MRSQWDYFREANCPDCQSPLLKVETNFHGTDVDIVNCEKCHHIFGVSYKVDQLTRYKDWETPDAQ